MSLALKFMVAAAALAMVILLALIIFGDNGRVELTRLRERQQALAERNQTLARENVDLYRIIKRLKNDLVFIESVARNELGMVGKDDLVIIRPQGPGRDN